MSEKYVSPFEHNPCGSPEEEIFNVEMFLKWMGRHTANADDYTQREAADALEAVEFLRLEALKATRIVMNIRR